ncbi:MAG TPA: CRISPR-associated endonuclease Cas1, partial [bacterium]|nr:CRISPR-associated endonuclease Cas1 [bacterium]
LAAKEYFSVFDKGFIKSQGFRVRRRRPPTDPVNAVLSLLYTMLFYRVDNAVERRGLDPYLGHLHAHSYGRRSLVLDLMEEFRPIVVDTLVLSLFNLNIISASDFEYFQNDEETTDIMSTVKPVTALSQPDVTQDAIGVFSEGRVDTMPREYHAETDVMTSLDDDGHDEATGKRAMVLAKPALKKVLEQFENKLDTEFYHERLSARTTYRKAIDEQVDHYADFLRGDVAVYEPLVMR